MLIFLLWLAILWRERSSFGVSSLLVSHRERVILVMWLAWWFSGSRLWCKRKSFEVVMDLQVLWVSPHCTEQDNRLRKGMWSQQKQASLPLGGGLVTQLCSTLTTPWTAALQAPLSMGFSSQEHWSGLPFPPPGIVLTQGWNPRARISCIAGRLFAAEPPGQPPLLLRGHVYAPLFWAMAPLSSTLAWKIPWTEEPGRLQSMGSQRVGQDWATSLHLLFWACFVWASLSMWPTENSQTDRKAGSPKSCFMVIVTKETNSLVFMCSADSCSESLRWRLYCRIAWGRRGDENSKQINTEAVLDYVSDLASICGY